MPYVMQVEFLTPKKMTNPRSIPSVLSRLSNVYRLPTPLAMQVMVDIRKIQTAKMLE